MPSHVWTAAKDAGLKNLAKCAYLRISGYAEGEALMRRLGACRSILTTGASSENWTDAIQKRRRPRNLNSLRKADGSFRGTCYGQPPCTPKTGSFDRWLGTIHRIEDGKMPSGYYQVNQRLKSGFEKETVNWMALNRSCAKSHKLKAIW